LFGKSCWGCVHWCCVLIGVACSLVLRSRWSCVLVDTALFSLVLRSHWSRLIVIFVGNVVVCLFRLVSSFLEGHFAILFEGSGSFFPTLPDTLGCDLRSVVLLFVCFFYESSGSKH